MVVKVGQRDPSEEQEDVLISRENVRIAAAGQYWQAVVLQPLVLCLDTTCTSYTIVPITVVVHIV